VRVRLRSNARSSSHFRGLPRRGWSKVLASSVPAEILFDSTLPNLFDGEDWTWEGQHGKITCASWRNKEPGSGTGRC
jgi:hypothetical protein